MSTVLNLCHSVELYVHNNNDINNNSNTKKRTEVDKRHFFNSPLFSAFNRSISLCKLDSVSACCVLR